MERPKLTIASPLLAGLLLTGVVLTLAPSSVRAASEKPKVEWTKTYGGEDPESAWSVIQTSDGGFAIAGYTNSYGAGKVDFYLVKLAGGGPPRYIPWALIGGVAMTIAIVGVFVYLRKR